MKIEKYKTKKNFRFAVIDTETEGLDSTKFILGVYYDGERYEVFYDKDDMIRYIKERDIKYVFGHNVEYDLSVLYGNIMLRGNAGFRGSRLIFFQDENIIYLDSINVLLLSLKKVGGMFGYEKMSYEENKNSIESLREYCKRDCFVLYNSLKRFFKEIDVFGFTLASCSMNFFTKKFLKSDILVSGIDEKTKYAYYGGRVEVINFNMKEEPLYVFDINSMYPYVMKEREYPHPSYLTEAYTKSSFFPVLDNKEGIARVKVRVKDDIISPIPKKINNKLIFPVGTFWTDVSFEELRTGIELGYLEIVDFQKAIYSTKKISIFREFVDYCYEKRKEDKLRNYIYKIIMNSLYGKFAQGDAENLILVDNVIDGDINTFYLIKEHIFRKVVTSVNKNRAYILALHVTAFARSHLFKYMHEIKDKLYYVDTDSLFVRSEDVIPKEFIGNELGMLKKEEKIVLRIYGNKHYLYLEDGEIFMKIKGVPKNNNIEMSNDKMIFEYERLIKTRESLRRGLNPQTPVKVIKEILEKYDKRVVNDDGTTLPIKLDEI